MIIGSRQSAVGSGGGIDCRLPIAETERTTMADSTNLLLPYIEASQAQKHVTHNEAIRLLDALIRTRVVEQGLTTPPGSPADGTIYIPAPAPPAPGRPGTSTSPITWTAPGRRSCRRSAG